MPVDSFKEVIAPVSLESVLCTEQLDQRPSRPPDYQAEIQALLALVQALKNAPRQVLQRLVDTALDLCRGHSAGISLLEEGPPGHLSPMGDHFRWHAVAGQWAPLIWDTTTRRDYGPCGTVLDRNCTLLFVNAHRYYKQFAGVQPLLIEGLLVPFHVEGRAVGTVWVVAHDDSRKFDAEDRRMLESLATFAGTAYQVLANLKAAEQQAQALRESEARFRQMADNAPVILWVTEPDASCSFLSQSWYEFTGQRPETGLGFGWMDAVHPDDRAPARETFINASTKREAFHLEYRLRRKDGEYSWAIDSAVPRVGSDGRFLGHIGSVIDITDRKQREIANAFLAAIVRSSDDAIISKDLNGVITSWNDGAQKMFGYTAQEAIGQPVTMLIPRDRIDEEPSILERLRRGERIDHYETVRRGKNGNLLNISLTVSPVTDAQGQIIGASKVARDITQRKRAERELQEADRRKSEFLAMLSHELRNPLAPMRNAVEILRQLDVKEPQMKWVTELMHRQLGHMSRLIDDLLDVSRISRGKLELHREIVDVAAAVSQSVEAVRPMFECMEHQLTMTQQPQPIYLNADPIRLAQVVGNLLNNACKFTDRGGHIRLSIQTEDGQAVIRVQDTGIGIAAEQLPRIFEMFTQADTSLERSRDGLGIGLMLVKNLVEMHGGTVEAHSTGLGQGSEFVVRLPVVSEPPSKTQPQEPSGTKQATTTQKTQRRILVVDDNRDSAGTLRMMCELSGHQVHTAYDGLDAVEAAAKFQPDVILLDIGLPGLNGYEAARRIRCQPRDKDLMMVALTGWGQKEDRDRSKEAGFDAHLVKPVDFDALKKLLASECGVSHP